MLQRRPAILLVIAIFCVSTLFGYLARSGLTLKDGITLLFGAIALIVSLWSRLESALSEKRQRYSWAVSLDPHGDHYVLRNLGTANAHDVRLANAQDFAALAFVRHDRDAADGPSIPHGESKAFIAVEAFSRIGTELVIEWRPEGETQRRSHTEVLPPAPDKLAAHGEKRDRERAAEAAAYVQHVTDTRRLLLDLAVAWGEYQMDTSNQANKLRVQAIVAALPANFAKEIGYAVDVQRDFWGPNQWPLSVFVSEDADKELVDMDSASIELIWNLLELQIPRLTRDGYSATPRRYHRIEHAVSGYVDLVRRRERDDRELIISPKDHEQLQEAKKRFEELDKLQRASKVAPESAAPVVTAPEGGQRPAE